MPKSQANAGQATSDDISIDLSPKGKQQANAFAESITEAPSLIVCSKYMRTQYTAAPLINKFPNVRVTIFPLHEFTYLSPVTCAGTTVNQRRNQVVDYWEQASCNFVHGEGAESFTQFTNRVGLCIELLLASEYQNIFVFTHGHVLRSFWQQLSGLTFGSKQEQMAHFHQKMSFLPVPNTCVFKACAADDQMYIIEPQFDPC